ncbi:hypothetical protein MMC10_001769 [Thelotrema lepadinum]|nr:hypothetical protein [Thelotrema lepadinum]
MPRSLSQNRHREVERSRSKSRNRTQTPMQGVKRKFDETGAASSEDASNIVASRPGLSSSQSFTLYKRCIPPLDGSANMLHLFPSPDAAPHAALRILTTDPSKVLDVVGEDQDALEEIAVRHPHYRIDVLERNGVYISDFGIGSDDDVFQFARKLLALDPNVPMPSESDLREMYRLLTWMIRAQTPNTLLVHMSAILPVKPPQILEDLGRIVGTGLPAVNGVPYKIARPSCTLIYGYSHGLFMPAHQKLVSQFEDYARPGSTAIFPFFAMFLVCPVSGQTMYAAESQAAAFGAQRLNSLRILYKLSGSAVPPATDTTVFSCILDYASAVFWVHWLEGTDEKPIFKSREIRTLNLRYTNHLNQVAPMVKQLWDYGLNERLLSTWALLNALALKAQEGRPRSRSPRPRTPEQLAKAKAPWIVID